MKKLKSLEMACFLSRRKFKIPSSSRCGLVYAIPSLIGKFEQTNYVIMAMAEFSFSGKVTSFCPGFFPDSCRPVWFSEPELK
jgi:hypothetical protein